MLTKRSRRMILMNKFVITIAATAFLLWPVISSAVESARQEAATYDRADAETIKTLTQQILSEHDFTRRMTFWEWLMEKFSQWDMPNISLGSGWINVICWIIIIWCILTLVAILIHFLWTIYILVRRDKNPFHSKSDLGSKTVKITSFEELYKMAREFAAEGAFNEAISVMTIALLRWLDSKDIVRFHESKTNGDYLREYPAGNAGKDEFRKFVLISERTIYGGVGGSNGLYDKMNSLMENIFEGVCRKEQN